MGANAMKSAGKGCEFLPALIFALFSFFISVSCAALYAQEEGRQPIGSLTATDEVYVNDVAAPSTSTIFAGDMLRTGETGAATLVLDGKGSFRISPHTEMTFTGQPQHVAELKLGKVVMDGQGATGINVRTGNSVVVPLAEGEESTSVIEAPSDGSFLVSCETGSVSVLPLEGGKGVFIEAGQSASISAQGELSVVSSAAPPSTTALTEPARKPEPAARQTHGLRRWILIGAVAAGAGVAAVMLTANGSASSSAASAVVTPRPSVPGPTPDPPPTQPSNSPQAPASANPNPPSAAPPAPPPPTPSGHDCDHHKKNCSPQVVVGFAFHF
jgi:hypothetical protein